MSDGTLFENDNSCIIPSKSTKYLCPVILQIQSVYHSTKDEDKDVEYHLRVLLNECCYEFFLDIRKVNPRLKHTNNPKPEPASESEPEP